MTNICAGLLERAFPERSDLVDRLRVLIDGVRPALEEQRSHFPSPPGAFPLDSGESLLVVPRDIPGGIVPEQLEQVLEEVWEHTLSGIMVSSLADLSGAISGDLVREHRLMTELLPEPSPEPPSGAESFLAMLEQLLGDLSRGVQILAVPDLFRPSREEEDGIVGVLKEANPDLLLAGDHARGHDLAWPGGRPREGREPLGQVLLEAVLNEDGRGLGEWLQALPDRESCRAWINQVPFLFRGAGEGARMDVNLPLDQQARSLEALHTLQCALAGVPAFVLPRAILQGAEDLRAGAGDGAGDGDAKGDSELGELAGLVLPRLRDLLRIRLEEPAFDPVSSQRVVPGDPRMVVLERGGAGARPVLCLQNLSRDPVEFRDRLDRYPWPESAVVEDILTGDLVFPSREGELFSFELQPREVLWLRFGESSPE